MLKMASLLTRGCVVARCGVAASKLPETQAIAAAAGGSHRVSASRGKISVTAGGTHKSLIRGASSSPLWREASWSRGGIAHSRSARIAYQNKLRRCLGARIIASVTPLMPHRQTTLS